jgi:hypothetical protein
MSKVTTLATLNNQTKTVVLYGYWPGDYESNPSRHFLATFDDKEMAEDYVINSIKKVLKRSDYDLENEYEFKSGTLLEDFHHFDIRPFEFPHNPKI